MPSAAAQREIDDLDRALALDGEDIWLRRVVGTASQVNIDVRCRAFVRAFAATELIAGISQRDSKVTLSPTEITRAQWPGGQPISAALHQSDPRLPRDGQNGDIAIIQGKPRKIAFTKPTLVDGELVRLDLQVSG